MKLAVIGTGGMGGYFGGRLAMSGNEVHFVARGRNLHVLREHGLRVESVNGDFAIPPAPGLATDEPADIGACDVVLFTVKSFDTEEAIGLLPPLIGPDTAVLTLQNGIDNEDKIAAGIGSQHVMGGVAFILLELVEPGLVRHSGGPSRVGFGEMDGRRTPRAEALLAAFQAAGVGAEIVPDVRVALWTKYAFICAQAGLTATTRLPIGPIRETPETWPLFRAVVQEVADLAAAEGIALAPDVVDRQVATAASLAPTSYASLHNDLVAGRRMELEALLGEVVRRSERAQTAAPVSRVLYGLLKPWAERAAAARPTA